MIKSNLVMFSALILVGCQQSNDSIASFISQVENQSRKEIAQLEPEKRFKRLNIMRASYAFLFVYRLSRSRISLVLNKIVGNRDYAAKQGN